MCLIFHGFHTILAQNAHHWQHHLRVIVMLLSCDLKQEVGLQSLPILLLFQHSISIPLHVQLHSFTLLHCQCSCIIAKALSCLIASFGFLLLKCMNAMNAWLTNNGSQTRRCVLMGFFCYFYVHGKNNKSEYLLYGTVSRLLMTPLNADALTP